MDNFFSKNRMFFLTLFLCLVFGVVLGLAGQLTAGSMLYRRPALFFIGGVTASFFMAMLLFAFLEDKKDYLPFYFFLGPVSGAFGLGPVVLLSVLF